MEPMPSVHLRCCGIDVHKETVVVCVRSICSDGRVDQDVRTFATTTRALLELGDWLAECDVTLVAMDLR